MIILVIDDDFEDQPESKFMLEFLKSFGFKAEFVRNGYAGIEILKQNPGKYCAIFLDMVFKKRIDGLMFCDMIREFDSTTPVIAISGNEEANKMMVKRKKRGIEYCQGYVGKRDWQNPKMVKKISKMLEEITATL